jgi:hypothetical protein
VEAIMEKLVYLNNCVNWPKDDVHADGGLCDMIGEAVQVTRDTFLRHVDRRSREDLERELGYAPHNPEAVLTMRRDGCVSYWRSRLHGRTVYYIHWSAIEYVFASRAA